MKMTSLFKTNREIQFLVHRYMENSIMAKLFQKLTLGMSAKVVALIQAALLRHYGFCLFVCFVKCER